MIDLLAVQNPFTLKLALFVGAFLFAASAALVRPSIVQPLLTTMAGIAAGVQSVG
jgi:hypothetical protein